jgi:hypothetical protein
VSPLFEVDSVLLLVLSACALSTEPQGVLDTLTPNLCRTRGLPCPDRFDAVATDSKTAVARMVDMFEEFPEAVQALEKRQRMHEAFGTAHPSIPLFDGIAQTMSADMAGFWDVARGRMHVVSGSSIPPETFEMVIGHELVHGIQLASLPSHRKMDPQLGNADLMLAFEMALEGDATYTELLSRIPDLDTRDLREELTFNTWWGDPTQTLQATLPLPTAELEAVMLPYTRGASFVQTMRRRSGDWTALNAAYTSGLLSTEQVLHPEKSLQASWDGPTWIDLSALRAPKGWTEVVTDTHGELWLALLLRQRAEPEAWSIAAGWDGDRYRVYADAGGAYAVVWRSVWDTESDAQAFAAAARLWFPKADVQVRGTGVVVVDGASGKARKRWVKTAWNAPTTEPRDERAMWGPEAGNHTVINTTGPN